MNLIMKNLARAICFFSLTALMAQSNDVKTQLYIEQTASQYDLSETDIQDWIITSQHTSKQSGITHVYGIQQFKGIEVHNATFGLHFFNQNKVVAFDTKFISDLSDKISSSNRSASISAQKAVELAAKELGLKSDVKFEILSAPQGIERRQTIEAKQISETPIAAKLMYHAINSSEIVLTWDLYIKELGGEHAWSLKLDANSGKIVHQQDMTFNCYEHEHDDASLKHPIDTGHPEKAIPFGPLEESASNGPPVGIYNVFALPIENPYYGARSVVTDVHDTNASPYAWHDTNGSSGPEYSITRGNNVYAYENGDNPGFSPNGGGSLNFDFPWNPIWSTSNQSESAALTNAFYWANIMHDISYQYGFDEASGNFQENNYGNGGTGSDYVNVEIQTSVSCGATWSPEFDGTSPTMNLRIGSSGCPIPAPEHHDAAIDNLVIVHEYGHGIGFRLVGGPNDIYAYVNPESPSEGISDWFGMMMTMQPSDMATDSRTIGSWLLADPNSPGFREYPYTTDMSINPKTYKDIAPWGGFHKGGEVYAAVLWEMTWNLIGQYGFDADFYNGTGGNNIALQLVIESLKLVPAESGFVDYRDAIIQADQILNAGTNNCHIWRAFAKRGIGLSADQGTTTGSPSTAIGDETEAFDVPSYCSCNEADLIIDDDVQSGWIDFQEASNTIVAINTIFSGGRAEYNAGTSVTMTPGFHAQSGSEILGYIEGCTGLIGFMNSITYEEIDLTSYEVDSKEEFKSLNISPNPNTGKFVLKGSHDMKQWEVSNYMGRVYFTGKMNEKDSTIQQIDISNLPTGIYFIKVEFQDGEIITKQVIKE